MNRVEVFYDKNHFVFEAEVNQFLRRIYKKGWGLVDIKFSNSRCYDSSIENFESEYSAMVIYEVGE